MALKSDLPFGGGRIKFIVVECAADIWIMARNIEYHEDVMKEFKFEHGGIHMGSDVAELRNPKCIGGGRIAYSVIRKYIHAYGYSIKYGKADQILVERLIAAFVEEEQKEDEGDWEIKIEMGVGY